MKKTEAQKKVIKEILKGAQEKVVGQFMRFQRFVVMPRHVQPIIVLCVVLHRMRFRLLYSWRAMLQQPNSSNIVLRAEYI